MGEPPIGRSCRHEKLKASRTPQTLQFVKTRGTKIQHLVRLYTSRRGESAKTFRFYCFLDGRTGFERLETAVEGRHLFDDQLTKTRVRADGAKIMDMILTLKSQHPRKVVIRVSATAGEKPHRQDRAGKPFEGAANSGLLVYIGCPYLLEATFCPKTCRLLLGRLPRRRVTSRSMADKQQRRLIRRDTMALGEAPCPALHQIGQTLRQADRRAQVEMADGSFGHQSSTTESQGNGLSNECPVGHEQRYQVGRFSRQTGKCLRRSGTALEGGGTGLLEQAPLVDFSRLAPQLGVGRLAASRAVADDDQGTFLPPDGFSGWFPPTDGSCCRHCTFPTACAWGCV